MNPHCSANIGSCIEIDSNTYYYYCNNCKEYHQVIFVAQEIPVVGTPAFTSHTSTITEEEYSTGLLYLRL